MARRKKKAAIKIKLKPNNKSSCSNVQATTSLKKNKQTKEERLEKKRIAEQKRLEKIRSDPIRYAEFKEKQRRSYHKRKAEKKILPISEMSSKARNIIRKRNRDNFRKHYYKKKERARLEVILQENSPPESDADIAEVLLDPAPIMDEDQNLNIAGPSQPKQDTPRHRRPWTNIDRLRNMSPKSTSSRGSSISTSASTSVYKASLLRYKYQKKKEIMELENKINKLMRIKEAYRKKCQRLQNTQCRQSKDDTQENTILKNIPNKRAHKYNVALSALKKDVMNFFEEDENSRVCPGKKEYITRGKQKMQKRYLNDSMKNLYQRYKTGSVHQTVSYTTFCRFRPFWVRVPDINARETCLCKLHANVELLVSALKRRHILSENSCTEICQSMCCASNNVQCLLRNCEQCGNRSLDIKEFDDLQPITYWQWQAKPKVIDKKGVDTKIVITEKVKITTNPRSAIDELGKLLTPFLQHCGIIVNQSVAVKSMKENLCKEECVLHIDYSENYAAKFAKEIQTLHFGGNRSQITLHTAVLYYIDQSCADEDKYKTQAFCTLSASLRHDAAAVWAHLIPLLEFIEEKAPQVKTLHFISDSPSSQYRNKKTFYMMAKLHWHFKNLERLTWNYSESGHGKGAPDGVGGLLKRTADQIVAYGEDISSLEDLIGHLRSSVTGVQMEVVEDYAIYEKDLLIPDVNVQPFRGTIKTHQVIWNKEHGDRLAMRLRTCGVKECFSNAAVICSHGNHIGFHDVEKHTECKKTSTSSMGRSKAVKKLMSFPIAKSFKKGSSNRQDIKVLTQKTLLPSTEPMTVHSVDHTSSPENRQSIEESFTLDENICLNTPTTSEIGSLSKYWNDNEAFTSLDVAEENIDLLAPVTEDPLATEPLPEEDFEDLIPYTQTDRIKIQCNYHSDHDHLDGKEHPIRDITNTFVTEPLDTENSKDLSRNRLIAEFNVEGTPQLSGTNSQVTSNLEEVLEVLPSVQGDNSSLIDNLPNETRPKIGDFILAKFAATKGKTTFMYVCLIKEVCDDGKLVIQGYKSVKKNKTIFRAIPKDISLIEASDIECILPVPKPSENDTSVTFPNDVNVKEM